MTPLLNWFQSRLPRLLAAVAVAAAAIVIVPAPAKAAWTDGACSDALGVTVAVDYGGLGGGVAVRCAENFAASGGSTGLDALRLAGFSWSPAQQFPGSVCRVNGRPAATENLPVNGGYREQCVRMPPTSAYWGYFYAGVGGSWTYSSSGAGRTVQPGGFEGWAFQLNASTNQPPKASTNRGDPKPTQTGPATTKAPTTATTKATTGKTTANRSATAKAPTTAGASSSTPTTTTAAPTGTPSSAEPSLTPSDPPSETPSDTGSPIPVPPDTPTSTPQPAPPSSGRGATIAGVSVIAAVALAGGGFWWWRRRHP